MKYDPLKAFPYPVLRPDSTDYFESDIQLIADFSIDGNMINAEVFWALSNDEIVAEIDRGNAQYLAVISCRDTYFQASISSSEPSSQYSFNSTDLRGEVIINSYVVVVSDINSFQSDDINPEFASTSFSYTIGDVLAQSEPQLFYIDRDMFKPVTSVFELVKKDDVPDGEWSVSFDEDHVQIELNGRMKEKIDNARNSPENKVILINSIYFAAVVEAIYKLKHEKDDVSGYKWAEIITRQAENRGLDIESMEASILAQKLIDAPLDLLIKHVFRSNDDES